MKIIHIIEILKIISGVQFFEDYSRVSKPRLVDYSLFFPSLITVFLTQRILIPIFKSYGTKKYLNNTGQRFADEERMYNYARRFYSGIFHTICSIMCFLFFHRRIWWFPNCGVLAVTYTYDVRYNFYIRLYYNVEGGYVMYKSFALLYERYVMGMKKEFPEMFIHHTTTTVLVFLSYFSMYAYEGILVFFLHNLSDVFTYLCRCHADIKSKFAVIFLPLCILSWVVLRLFMFPTFVIANSGRAFSGDNIKNHHYFISPFLVFLLVILYVLNIYWVYGLCRVMVNIASNGYQQKAIATNSEHQYIPLANSNNDDDDEVEGDKNKMEV